MDKKNDDLMSLATLNNGATLEKIDNELRELAKNILDPNTSPTAVRELNIKIKIKPSESRRVANAQIVVTAKTAAVRPDEASFRISAVGTEAVMSEIEDKQEEMFQEKEEPKQADA